MGKLLSSKDRILIGLSFFGDLLETIGDELPSKKKWHNNAFSMMGNNFRKNSYLSSVSRMLKSELIERVVDNGVAKIRITSFGKEQFHRDFPFFKFQNQKWDGKWRIVTFDIPEKKRKIRQNLRYKLRELGFAMLQKSIWISPHNFEDDIREFFDENKLGEIAFVFVAEKLLVGNIKDTVNKLWNLKKINDLYKKAKDKKSNQILCEALSKDPFLPKELLPKNWQG